MGRRDGLGFAVLALVCGTAAAPLLAADIDPRDLAAFVDGFVEGRMDAEHVVGATVSVVQGGTLIFARGYGYDELDSGRRVDAERTLFRPGSISKTFTWTAVMQLVEQGTLDLDADIRTYLPDFHIADNFEQPITLRHLMAHTAGFEDSGMGHLFGNDPGAVLPLADYLRLYRPERVRPPGELPAYSNYGVALAGLIVANVSGLAWEDYVERTLLRPLGMARSTFREPLPRAQPAPMPAALRGDVSTGYARRTAGYEPGTFTFISQIGPAGALSATATDMARWMLMHLNDGELDGARVLRADTAQRMHRQHHSLDPRMPGMAHGFIESWIHGYRAIGHPGGTLYFFSDMELLPELDLGVFISTNTRPGGGTLIDQFAEALVARYYPPGPLTLEAATIAAAGRPIGEYAGTYISTRRPYSTVEALFLTNGATVSVTPAGALMVAGPLGAYRLEPLGGDRFRSSDTGQPVTFTSNQSGAIAAMLLPVPTLVLERTGGLGNPSTLFSLLLLAFAVLACAVVGACLRWRAARTYGDAAGPRQSIGEAWAARVLLLTAIVWLAAAGLGAYGSAPLGSDMSKVFFDFPSTTVVASLALVLTAAALTLASLMLLWPVWHVGSWPIWRRIRHTGVVVAAVVACAVLLHFNAVGFNYLPH